MVDWSSTVQFIIVDDLFDNYTILVNTTNKYTSVYCEQCEQWVEQYDGDKISTQTSNELYEMIVEAHTEQVLGKHVRFDNSIENFI